MEAFTHTLRCANKNASCVLLAQRSSAQGMCELPLTGSTSSVQFSSCAVDEALYKYDYLRPTAVWRPMNRDTFRIFFSN